MGADRVRWLGHATVLLELGGARLLTDPALGRWLGHLTRRVAPVDPAALAALDGVLISHVHRDHLDLPSLRALDPTVPLVVPRGAAGFVPPGRTVHELEAGEAIELGGATVRATPAVHEARRGGAPVPSVGYVIDDRIYFAGDTDRFDAMAELAPLDLALLPVWGWGTSLGPGHLDPAGAAATLPLLRPRVAVPIHWGTFFPAPLGLRGHPRLTDPPHEFAAAAARLAPEVEVAVLAPGETLGL